MDSIKIEKIHALKMYKRNELLKSLFLYSFTALACLFYSSPFWFPTIASSMELLLLVHVPKLTSLLFNAKFVFIVGNIIVVALIGESKIFSSNTKTRESCSYYEEYITTKQNLQKLSAPSNNEYQKKDKLCVAETKRVCEDHKVEKVVKRLEGFDGKKNLDRHLSMPRSDQELKKRADDFIARVNKRRVFEARELLCDV